MERVEKYVEERHRFKGIYESRVDIVEHKLAGFYHNCMENGESTFSIPALELVSVVSGKDYNVLSRLVLEAEESYEMRQNIYEEAQSDRKKDSFCRTA